MGAAYDLFQKHQGALIKRWVSMGINDCFLCLKICDYWATSTVKYYTVFQTSRCLNVKVGQLGNSGIGD